MEFPLQYKVHFEITEAAFGKVCGWMENVEAKVLSAWARMKP